MRGGLKRSKLARDLRGDPNGGERGIAIFDSGFDDSLAIWKPEFRFTVWHGTRGWDRECSVRCTVQTWLNSFTAVCDAFKESIGLGT